jgi:hypothetical protein
VVSAASWDFDDPADYRGSLSGKGLREAAPLARMVIGSLAQGKEPGKPYLAVKWQNVWYRYLIDNAPPVSHLAFSIIRRA